MVDLKGVSGSPSAGSSKRTYIQEGKAGLGGDQREKDLMGGNWEIHQSIWIGNSEGARGISSRKHADYCGSHEGERRKEGQFC